METLRGLTGSDFEGPARVTRGNTSGLCSCFGNNNGEPVSITAATCSVYH